MSYAKIPKVCRDYGLGFQDFNQACDNVDATVALYDVRHGVGSQPSGSTQNPWAQFGKHDDPRICRTLLRIQNTTIGSIVSSSTVVAGTGIASAQRVGAGQWQIDLRSGVGTFAPVVQVEDSGTEVFHFTVYSFDMSLLITFWQLSGGVFVAADVDFSVFVWGSGA